MKPHYLQGDVYRVSNEIYDPSAQKPVASHIFYFLSTGIMHHLKKKDIPFTMKQKVSFYFNPN